MFAVASTDQHSSNVCFGLHHLVVIRNLKFRHRVNISVQLSPKCRGHDILRLFSTNSIPVLKIHVTSASARFSLKIRGTVLLLYRYFLLRRRMKTKKPFITVFLPPTLYAS